MSYTRYARLSSRALLCLRGHDAATFLQGLTSANVPATLPAGTPASLYSAFLNAQGRVLQDVFIFPIRPSSPLWSVVGSGAEDPTFLIEVDTEERSKLQTWLKRYKLRAKIEMRVLDSEELRVYSMWTTDSTRPSTPDDIANAAARVGHLAPDDRAPAFATRLLIPPSAFSSLAANEVSEREYTRRRHLWGIPEGQKEIVRESALLQDSNIDLMGGVDFRKGCYVGQELVIRTQHTGVVRKRILPMRIYQDSGSDGNAPRELEDADSDFAVSPAEHVEVTVESVKAPHAEGQGIEPGRKVVPFSRTSIRGTSEDVESTKPRGANRSAGTWLAGVGDVGLALCRMESMGLDYMTLGEERSSAAEFQFEAKEGEGSDAYLVRAFVPKWWKDRKR